tara:strand:+ start:86 stop:346 length:261 start_codon:yes stop_codon:yes gene_type:complete
MSNNFHEKWFYYLKKEQEATIGSTKAVYAKLKELERDRFMILTLFIAGHETSYYKVIDFLDEQIKKNEEKLAILMNLEVDLPEFYD